MFCHLDGHRNRQAELPDEFGSQDDNHDGDEPQQDIHDHFQICICAGNQCNTKANCYHNEGDQAQNKGAEVLFLLLNNTDSFAATVASVGHPFPNLEELVADLTLGCRFVAIPLDLQPFTQAVFMHVFGTT